MFPSRLFRFAFALLALASLSAADTLSVGPVGSGAQFSEIQAAIDAAQADDVILVQPGTYQRITVAKPLRILGDGTGSVTITWDEFSVIVRDIGAGEELVLSGVEVTAGLSFSPSSLILLQDCPGTVVLQDVFMDSGFGLPALQVESCARALLLDSRVFGGGAAHLACVFARDSTLWIANAEITNLTFFFESAGPGVHLLNSTLHAWRATIRGGDLGGAIDFTGEDSLEGGHGILAAGSTVNLFGGPTSSVVGGQGGTSNKFGAVPFPGGAGVRLTGNSHARIQADIPIQAGLDGLGHNPAPTVQTDGSSSFTLDAKVFPTLVSSAQQTQLGSTLSLTLAGNPGGYQVLYLSLRSGPTRSYRGADGFSLLDRANLFHVASEVLPASGAFAIDIRVPDLSALLGSTLFFQTAERFPDGLALRQSGPANRFAIGNPVLVTVTH